MLDLESFTYLNRALESPIAPIVILASNRGRTTIRTSHSDPSFSSDHSADSSLVSAHGIPPDLLARLLIIPTHPYAADEIRTIINLRARTEGVNIEDEALNAIAGLGSEVSLRYALQIMTPASVLARVGGREKVNAQDVEEAKTLFLDARRSARVLKDAKVGEFVV